MLSLDDLDEEIDSAADWRVEIRLSRIEAGHILSNKKESATKAEAVSNVTTNINNVRLPHIDLPRFRGELTSWQSFWDRFTALVDESDLPLVNKFTYLLSLLEGEASCVVKGLSLTSKNYKVACGMLKERLGRPERIIFAHIQGLLNVKVPTKGLGREYVSSLWKLQDELRTHITERNDTKPSYKP